MDIRIQLGPINIVSATLSLKGGIRKITLSYIHYYNIEIIVNYLLRLRCKFLGTLEALQFGFDVLYMVL